jgi:hypothetical protein
MISYIFVQLVYISFFFIGFSLSSAAMTFAGAKISSRIKNLFALHPLISLVVSFCIGLIAMSPSILIGYLFGLSVYVVVIWYVVLIVFSIFRLRSTVKHAQAMFSQRLFTNKYELLLLSAVVLVLVIDYMLASRHMAAYWSDAFVHIARVNYMIDANLTLVDPYFGNNGVVDPRYSMNLLAAVQSAMASIGNISAVSVWNHSYAMYRLVIWLSIFSFSYIILPKQHRLKIAYGVLALAPILYSGYFLHALFPDRIALAWSYLLIAGIVLYLHKANPLLLYVGAVLIAFTHPLNALIAFGFVVLCWLVVLVYKKRLYHHLLLSAGVLLVPVGLLLAYPNRVALSDKGFNAAPISGGRVVYEQYGPFILHKIDWPEISLLFIFAWLCLFAYLLLVKKVNSQKRRALLLAPWVVGLLLSLNALLLNAFGYAQLIIKNHWYARIVAILLAVYYGLIVYNPLLMALAQDKIPPWVIARFQELNLLALIMLPIGLCVLVITVLQYVNLRKYTNVAIVITVFAAAFVIPYITTATLPYPFVQKQTSIAQGAVNREVYIQRLQGLTIHDTGMVILTGSEDGQFAIPAVLRAYTVSNLTWNYSSMANIPLREQCHATLVDKLDLNDLRAAGVTHVIADQQDPLEVDFVADSRQRDHLRLIESVNGLDVYRVEGSVTTPGDSACMIPYGQ